MTHPPGSHDTLVSGEAADVALQQETFPSLKSKGCLNYLLRQVCVRVNAPPGAYVPSERVHAAEAQRGRRPTPGLWLGVTRPARGPQLLPEKGRKMQTVHDVKE